MSARALRDADFGADHDEAGRLRGVSAPRFRGAIATILLAVLVPVFASSVARAGIVDGIVGVIDGNPITMRELVLAAKIQRILHGVRPLDAPVTRKEANDAALRIAENHLIIKELSYFKTTDTPQTEQSVEAMTKTFRSYFPDQGSMDDFLAAYGLTEGSLHDILKQRYYAEDFIRKRVTIFISVSEPEIESYYHADEKIFAGAPLSAVRQTIRQVLYRMKYDQQYRQVLDELSRRTTIEFFLDRYPYVDIFKD